MNYSVPRRIIVSHYKKQGRHNLPWRQTTNPYRILVSEIMLQQTQVDRVVPYYKNFLKQFPTPRALAAASRGDVLRAWQGLGYNRRAKFLHETAQKIVAQHKGIVPRTYNELVGLPGVGTYTAHAVRVFAHNELGVFLETNIRAVLLHHFFKDHGMVHDKELVPILTKLVRGQDPRVFYWALMDYGSYLKKVNSNPSRKSKHYAKQSVFVGSRRQVRGMVLRALSRTSYTTTQLENIIADNRVSAVLKDLYAEALIQRTKNAWHL